MIVLGAKQEVYEEDGDGSTSDDHNAIAEEEKPEHVVDFAEPHIVHDKVEFDKDGAEW